MLGVRQLVFFHALAPWAQCLSTPALYLFSLSCEGASSTRWVAPRMPGQPRCSVSRWQRDTPSLCSAWMPPTSCSSLGPKVGDGQRGWRRYRCCGSRLAVGMWEELGITGMLPVFSVEPCLAPSCPGAGWLLSSGPVGGGRCSYCLQATMALEETPPTLLGTFFLPQTGAAKCGTW